MATQFEKMAYAGTNQDGIRLKEQKTPFNSQLFDAKTTDDRCSELDALFPDSLFSTAFE